MTLVYLSLSWLAGVYLASQLRVPAPTILLISLAPLAAAILWWKDDRVRLPALCLLVLAAGGLRYETALPSPADYSVAQYVGPRPVQLAGIVTAEPDVRDRDVRLVVSAYHIGSGADSYEIRGAVQVRVPRYADYRYGDNLLLSGTLHQPPAHDTFSYKDYLARQGIYAIMYEPRVEIVERNQGNALLAALYSSKRRLQDALTTYLPEPQAGLVQGILLGVRAFISDDLREDLRRTGLTHIIVVSGYNLTVLAALFQHLTEKRLGRGWAYLLGLVGIVIFTLMTGAEPPVVRAAIMVSMALLARAVGREGDAFTALAFTGALLVAFQPLLLWDVSYQLSFLATAGLVLLSPAMESAFARLPLGTGSLLGTTIAAQIMTLPVIALNFQQISLISPIANVLVQPVIPPMMALGAIVAFAGLSGHAVVQLVGWLTWLLGAYAVDVMRVMGSLPLAAVGVPPVPLEMQIALIIAYYAVVALVFYGATHGGRDAVQRAATRVATLARGRRSLVLLGLLAAVAVIVWLGVVVLLRMR